MSRIICIPDVHNQIARADAILAAETGYDRVIWANDVYDSYGDNPEMARNTALWFRAKLNDPRNVFLHSNHVWSYMFDTNPFARQCRGFSREKALRIWEVMNYDGQGFARFNRQVPYCLEQGILFTHAGVSRRLLDWRRIDDDLNTVLEWMTIEHRRAIEAYSNGGNAFSYEAGDARGGRYPVGGWIWCDFNEEFKTTSFPQIVGHTIHEKGPIFCAQLAVNPKRDERVYVRKASSDFLIGRPWALCLDTVMNHYSTLEDGILTIKECAWSSTDSLDKVIQIWQGRVR